MSRIVAMAVLDGGWAFRGFKSPYCVLPLKDFFTNEVSSTPKNNYLLMWISERRSTLKLSVGKQAMLGRHHAWNLLPQRLYLED